MHIQNLSESVFFIIFVSTKVKLLCFKWAMVRHNEYSIRFIPLTDLLHVLQEILPDIRPDQKKKCDE